MICMESSALSSDALIDKFSKDLVHAGADPIRHGERLLLEGYLKLKNRSIRKMNVTLEAAGSGALSTDEVHFIGIFETWLKEREGV
ncbi:hypothetical protein EBT31_17600 [bacterium]|nr:hypothetical protein [bacterium]